MQNDYSLYFTSPPAGHLDILQSLGGYYIGIVPEGQRLVFPNRFNMTFRDQSPFSGCAAEADMQVSLSYDQPRLYKQLLKIFKRMPGYAYNHRAHEELRLVGGRIEEFVWAGEPPVIRLATNEATFDLYEPDDTGMHSLWCRMADSRHGVPIGRIPVGTTKQDLEGLLLNPF